MKRKSKPIGKAVSTNAVYDIYEAFAEMGMVPTQPSVLKLVRQLSPEQRIKLAVLRENAGMKYLTSSSRVWCINGIDVRAKTQVRAELIAKKINKLIEQVG